MRLSDVGFICAAATLFLGCEGAVTQDSPDQGAAGHDSGLADKDSGDQGMAAFPADYFASFSLRFSQVQLDQDAGQFASWPTTPQSESLPVRLDIRLDNGSIVAAFGPEGKAVSLLSGEVRGNQLLLSGHGLIAPVFCSEGLSEQWTQIALDLDAQKHLSGTGHATGLGPGESRNGSFWTVGVNYPMTALVTIEPDHQAPKVSALFAQGSDRPALPWDKARLILSEGIVQSSFASAVQVLSSAPGTQPIALRWTEDPAPSQAAPWSGSRAWDGLFLNWDEVRGQRITVQSSGLLDLVGNASGPQSLTQPVADIGEATAGVDFEAIPMPVTWGKTEVLQGDRAQLCERDRCLSVFTGGGAGRLAAGPGSRLRFRYRAIVADDIGPGSGLFGMTDEIHPASWPVLTLAASSSSSAPTEQLMPYDQLHGWAWEQTPEGTGFWRSQWVDFVVDSPATTSTDTVGFSFEVKMMPCNEGTECGHDSSNCDLSPMMVLEKIDVVSP